MTLTFASGSLPYYFFCDGQKEQIIRNVQNVYEANGREKNRTFKNEKEIILEEHPIIK
jgi:adenylate cyclase